MFEVIDEPAALALSCSPIELVLYAELLLGHRQSVTAETVKFFQGHLI